jgi:hypothetical protein
MRWVNKFQGEVKLYREQFGRRDLTEGERKKLAEFKEQLDALPDDGDTD